MMQADVQRHCGHPACSRENGVALNRMSAHLDRLRLVQRAGLEQDVRGDRRLADVVEKPRHPNVPRGLGRIAELAGKVDHQGADGDRVRISLVVLRFQPGDADEGRHVVERARNVVDNRQDLGGGHALAEPAVGKHRVDDGF